MTFFLIEESVTTINDQIRVSLSIKKKKKNNYVSLSLSSSPEVSTSLSINQISETQTFKLSNPSPFFFLKYNQKRKNSLYLQNSFYFFFDLKF